MQEILQNSILISYTFSQKRVCEERSNPHGPSVPQKCISSKSTQKFCLIEAATIWICRASVTLAMMPWSFLDTGFKKTALEAEDEPPPRILVQVKSQDGDIRETTIQSLKGSMREVDYGLFISLSGYTKNAKNIWTAPLLSEALMVTNS